MKWHGARAEYIPTENAVLETRLHDFAGYEAAEKWLNENKNMPVYIWHDDAANLENPSFAMTETEAYRAEYKKIID